MDVKGKGDGAGGDLTYASSTALAGVEEQRVRGEEKIA